MTKTNINLMFLMGALFFSMSSLPGFHENAEVQSMDLLSMDCDIKGQMLENGGTAECTDLQVNKRKASLRVEKIEKNEKYARLITEVECRTCAEGFRRTTETVSVADLRNVADRTLFDLDKKVSGDEQKEKKLADRKELCLVDDEGVEIKTLIKQLECRVDKLKEMDEEKAAKYYSANIKDQVQDLLQNPDAGERGRGMMILNKLGRDLSIQCSSRTVQQNAMPTFNNPLTSTFASSEKTSMTGKEFVEGSACDMLAFGTHNQNVDNAMAALKMPGANRQAIKAWLSNEQAKMSGFFRSRGMELKTPANGVYGDLLFADLNENNEALKANLEKITAAHADLIDPRFTSPGGAQQGAGRLARGGIPNAPGVAGGNVVTGGARQPWPNQPQQQQRMGVQSVPAANAKPGVTPGYTGAPRMGAPVR